VIQSDAAGAIDQSPDDAADDEGPDDSLASGPVGAEPDPLSDGLLPAFGAASSFFAELERDDVERSFFAQPDPLKWIVGGANALVIVPSAPHSGQNLGPWSWIPWTTSVTWPQALHM
jgi:hypothetical protein